MSSHVHSAASWELKGNHQVPWSLMSPLVQEHSLSVANGLLDTAGVQSCSEFLDLLSYKRSAQ